MKNDTTPNLIKKLISYLRKSMKPTTTTTTISTSRFEGDFWKDKNVLDSPSPYATFPGEIIPQESLRSDVIDV